VVLDVPFDIFKEEADVDMPQAEEWNANITSRCGADPEGLRKAVDMLLGAERPVVLVGQGIKYGGAIDEFIHLVERMQIPVVCSASGVGTLDTDHPLNLGLIARNGTYPANHAARQADVLLALGVRFDDRTSSSWIQGYSFNIPPTKLIHVDIDPDEIARNYPVALGLMADVRTFLRQVLEDLDGKKAEDMVPPSRKVWLRNIDGWRNEWEEYISPGYQIDTTPIHPQRAAQEIGKVLPESAIMVSDVGVHHNWLIQYCKAKGPHSLIGSMGYGAMGFSVAGILGAKLAAPDRPCISVCGDGGFLMHANVLGTAAEYNLPVVWIVWNNYAYASIRGLQRGYLDHRELVTDFKNPDTGEPINPDFAAMARSAGIEGVRVDKSVDLGEAVDNAIKSERPFVIDANIQGEDNPGGAGVWELPGLSHGQPQIGERYLTDG
jgi:acetolactate synthase-1/2/3 large subunit